VGSLPKLVGTGAVVALVVALTGLLLARAWYHDDACTIEAWKCDLGGVGFAVGLYAGVAAAALLAAFAIALGVSAASRRSRRAKGVPPAD
jgi:hypothetical protein